MMIVITLTQEEWRVYQDLRLLEGLHDVDAQQLRYWFVDEATHRSVYGADTPKLSLTEAAYVARQQKEEKP